MKNVVGNWSVAPIYTFESPEAVTAQSQRDANLNGDSWPDRTIINTAGQGSGFAAANLWEAVPDFRSAAASQEGRGSAMNSNE